MRGRDYPNTLMGTFAHLRQAFADAERLTLHKELWEEQAPGVPRPPVDPALEALADVLDGTIPPLFEVSTADDVRRALNFAAEYGLTPALAAGPRLREAPAAWDPAAEDLAENAPEVLILSLDFGDEPKREGYEKPKAEKKKADGEDAEADDDADESDAEEDDEKEPAEVRFPEPLRAYRDRLARYREAVAAPAALHRAGRRFAISSRGLKTPDELLKNLRLAVQAGLPERAALAALTSDAADLLGQGGRLGTLEAGRQAHVVAMTGPFTNANAKVRHVLIDREHYERNADAKPIDPSKAKRKNPHREQAPAAGRQRRAADGGSGRPPRLANRDRREPADRRRHRPHRHRGDAGGHGRADRRRQVRGDRRGPGTGPTARPSSTPPGSS